jgi:transcriptional regulator with XRE-family HTH domain
MTARKPVAKPSKTPATAKPQGARRPAERSLAKRVGQALGRHRSRAGLTQAKVAAMLGIETETVSRLETGAIAATLSRLEQFAKIYECPAAAFFQEETDDAEELAATVTGILSPLSPDERKLLVNFLMEACRLFCQRKE